MRTRPPDVTSPNHIGQTWNTCPKCGKDWESIPPVKGVIHRTALCEECKAWILKRNT